MHTIDFSQNHIEDKGEYKIGKIRRFALPSIQASSETFGCWPAWLHNRLLRKTTAKTISSHTILTESLIDQLGPFTW